MNEIPIIKRNANLEILAKMINSVAKHYDCHVDYVADENRLQFVGDQDCCRHISEETLALFPRTGNADLPLKCPVDES